MMTDNLRGPGGPRPWDGQKSCLMLVLKRARRATRCFLPDQKILILAKVIAGSISQNTYNYIAVARFNREYLKISNFEAKNLSPPTFFEIKT